MSIQTDITVTLVEVEVGDEYDVLLTVRDPLRPSQDATTTSITPDQAAELIDELRAVAAEAREARAADDVARADASLAHAFDIDWPVQS